MSTIKVDKITGRTGTAGASSPLQLTGDTVTLTTPTIDSIKLTPGSAPGTPAEGQMYYDSTEDKVYVWKKGQTRKTERVMCGGTCFSAPTKYVNKGNFDGHIILTDLCAPKPVPSACQRMWMTTKQYAARPYFQTNERIIAIDG